jgi:hypothetical protein
MVSGSRESDLHPKAISESRNRKGNISLRDTLFGMGFHEMISKLGKYIALYVLETLFMTNQSFGNI